MREASGAVYRAAVRTPLVRIDLSDLGGPLSEVYLKLEVLQPIGSFKIRGAYNVLRQLTPSQLKDGVWTVSAGNAAQGVALAARQVAWISVRHFEKAEVLEDCFGRLGVSCSVEGEGHL